ncbi:hypothetical protein L5G28_03650 [Gordonia sp. HY285]|uniref:hypothetical protein n=1 Tax=Gordonia liuliyuniae TaxID=2911517 RepID=UPI001F45AF62|nr:hypothetical protein [Gordonia liuliyuniae]MCF8609258.1 hypothetical protein [Gordonia liuliyuniae]
MMARKSVGSVAAVVAVAGVTASLVGTGEADAATRHGIKLSHSQTVAVSQHGLGNAFSAIPYIPNLVYNPGWGRGIQHAANDAARHGGCISIGIITSPGESNLDYVSVYPARSCAR